MASSPESGLVVVLAGGTGGAKLARGVQETIGAERLAVIANTADDVEVYGVHVSPDPDLVTYWLADLIDERGYGIRGDTFEVMAALERAGRPSWFRLGDRDLAMCLVRTELLHEGERLTVAQGAVAHGAGVLAQVLPMSDQPVRTQVKRDGVWRPFQEFMVLDRAEGEVQAVDVHGIERARMTPEVRDVLRRAEAIAIGPSNPVASIGPILSVFGMRRALADATCPVVAVSPFVGGRALKGPTEAFCRHAGIALGAQGVAEAYADVLDGLVADEPALGVPVCEADT